MKKIQNSKEVAVNIRKIIKYIDDLPQIEQETAIIGIHTGGAVLAEKINEKLKEELEIGFLNISFYRDDFSKIGLIW